ncbi:glycosyltransferase involved in cell wall biosynthesis [Novosphingobium hassiacum]|uniref:Glycosyltransferase involved in cell wall biosynthesis n=1 Tax=Novosphingobium hassiacum TaxID=173676 RepID=A0A7W5ZTE5_9SPHN|nr:glycosyltransferase family 4 protein [Novosphingobium hassiacum]MBB3859645.1 glycosyltransferase involved in cell wall biosynthesis [Novosphingobium hassiacum]
MRIAHFLPNLTVGGRERIANDLARAGRALGQQPMLVGYEPVAANIATLTPQVEYVQLDRHDAGFVAKLRDLFRRERIALVHAHGHIAAVHLAQAIQGWADRPASLATMHLGMQGTWRWLWSIRRALRAMDGLNAVSNDLATTYATIAGRAVATIPNGIECAPYLAIDPLLPFAGAPFRFAMLSRLDPVKRHIDAVHAADRLIERGSDIELHIAGEGAMSAQIGDLASTRPWVRLAGSVDPLAFLSDKQVFLMPSRAEGSPLALIEAMASGLPSIVSDLPSLRALAGDAAHFVAVAHHDAMADEMGQLMTQPTQWRAMSRRARSRAKTLDLSVSSRRYCAIYADLVAAGRADAA